MPERKIDYETMAHRADTAFVVRAPCWQRLYIDAALALTDHYAALNTISEIDKRTLKISADTREVLMAQWLNGVLALFEKEAFLSHRIVFDFFDGKSIQATLWGEGHKPAKHGSPPPIKPVTPDRLKLGESSHPEPHFFAQIVF